VTGGEPLLRDDIADVIRTMKQRCPRARIVLSTNGLLPERLEKLLKQVSGIAVRVSLDAVGGLHDEIRGTEGAYKKALESLQVCDRIGVKDVGVCATMTKHNAGVVRKVQEFARDRGINFTFTSVHSSSVFFGDQDAEQPDPDRAISDMEVIRGRLFDSPGPKDWFKAYFVSGLIDVMRREPRPIECRALTTFFYIDPQGNVYPCHLWEQSVGNLLRNTFDEILEANSHTLKVVAACRKRCWMTCTVAPEMRRKLALYALKVGMAKIAHHARRVLKLK
jgi:MoaA/NifB/PqqE/SkfB family radical SAM enzyme